MMRVAWLAPYPTMYFPDQLELDRPEVAHPSTWIVTLLNHLRFTAGIELHIVTFARELSRDQVLVRGGVSYHFLRAAPGYCRVGSLFEYDRWRLQQALRRIQPDVVHAHGTEQAYSYAAVTSGLPSLVSIQGIMCKLIHVEGLRCDWRTAYYMVARLVEARTIRRGVFFVANTPFAEEFVKSVCDRAVVFRIPNPVDDAFFDVVRRPCTGRRVILYVGSLTRAKGVEDLVQAFSLAAGREQDLILRMVGPTESAYVQRTLVPLIEHLGVACKVELPGFATSEEVARELAAADMLVLPSYMDTSPNVISEAMAAGVPVIATTVGGIPQMVKNRSTGLLFEPGDVRALTSAVVQLLEHPERGLAMSEAARRAARETHNCATVVEKVRHAYGEVLRAAKER